MAETQYYMLNKHYIQEAAPQPGVLAKYPAPKEFARVFNGRVEYEFDRLASFLEADVTFKRKDRHSFLFLLAAEVLADAALKFAATGKLTLVEDDDCSIHDWVHSLCPYAEMIGLGDNDTSSNDPTQMMWTLIMQRLTEEQKGLDLPGLAAAARES